MILNLPDQQIGQIVNILATRPYAEVFELINEIQRQAALSQRPGLQPVPEQTPTPAAG